MTLSASSRQSGGVSRAVELWCPLVWQGLWVGWEGALHLLSVCWAWCPVLPVWSRGRNWSTRQSKALWHPVPFVGSLEWNHRNLPEDWFIFNDLGLEFICLIQPEWHNSFHLDLLPAESPSVGSRPRAGHFVIILNFLYLTNLKVLKRLKPL